MVLKDKLLKNKLLILGAIFFVCLLVLGFVVYWKMTEKNANDKLISWPSTQTQQYTLKQVSQMNELVLKGFNPTYTLYLPLPKQLEFESITLNLKILHPPLLEKDSNLTIKVNDTPLNSLWLDKKNENEVSWNVTIPKELIQGDFLPITFEAFLRRNDFCSDYDNPGNWVRITNNSLINYNAEKLKYDPQLSQLPFPFFSERSVSVNKNTIVLPDNASLAMLNSTFDFLAYLNSKSTWPGLEINSINLKNLNNDSKNLENNLIFVGTAKQLNLPKVKIDWPLTINAEGVFIEGNKKIDSETGIIILTRSPWQPTNAALVFTGATETAVRNALLAFSQISFAKLNFPKNYLLVPNQVQKTETNKKIDWSAVTLKELGYRDRTIQGGGQSSIRYVVDLPSNRIPKEMKLTILFNNDPLLARGVNQHSYSTLMLSVNDNPEDSISLMNKNDPNTWNVNAGGNYLLPGKNVLDFSFDLRPLEENCTHFFLSKTWARIYADTKLEVKFEPGLPPLSVNKFLDFFNEGGAVVLPDKKNYLESKLLNDITTIASKVKRNSLQLYLAADELNKNGLKQENIILIGKFNSNSLLSSVLKVSKLSLKNIEEKEKIPLLEKSNDPDNFGFIQVIPSPWDANQVAFVITGTTDELVNTAVNVLLNKANSAKLKGNTAIVYSDGTFVSFNKKDNKITTLRD